eukprot:TRINITY_DN12298_c0_g1_i1.p1 TRINITY_DN12298_c0_g1~~TRINITY_DN12298_c0_g1_i1.p1  ORF type:complete len:420 (+),score=74.35 TRINITY_DN12298_c0_g1_i1:35-1261(+)
MPDEPPGAEGSDASAVPAVLVLGGSTFMGRETVQALLELPARVCVVNRGRKYWGTEDPSGGRVTRVTADRRDTKEFAARLDAVTNQLRPGERWALVADFSAYDGKDMKAALSGLAGRFEVYAYISSDSVYEVSALAASGWTEGAGAPVTESASLRPSDPATRKRLRKADSYGDGKLEAEEALAAGLEEAPGSGRGVALRLPDVIGPYDDTLRLWAFWHWLRAGPESPPQVRQAPALKRARVGEDQGASSEEPPLAFVYSRDVARFIAALVHAEKPCGLRFDAVNLGCDEQLPLRDFLGLLAFASGLSRQPALAAVERPKSFLPSVDRPLLLCCRHMKEAYGFTATPLEEVLKACAGWFEASCKTFPEEATEAAMKLPAPARAPALASAGLPMPSRRESSSSSSESSDA